MRKFTHVIQVYKTPIYKRHVPFALEVGITRKQLAECILLCLQKAKNPEALANNSKSVITSLCFLPWSRIDAEKFGKFMDACDKHTGGLLDFPSPL